MFTKIYSVEPNDKQRAALTDAFKTLAEHGLSQGKKVVISVDQINGNEIVACLTFGTFSDTKIIGARGGIRTV